MQLSIYKKIAKDYSARAKARRENINQANLALSLSKRSIFAQHRDDLKTAEKLLKDVLDHLKNCEKSFKKFPELAYEGSYLAALEEYAEAQLFINYLKKKTVVSIDYRCMRPQTYLGGLSDMTGEISRYAIRQATQGNYEEVKKATKTVEEVISFLYQLDLTGYLRTKFDQAKKNLRHLEQMNYEIN